MTHIQELKTLSKEHPIIIFDGVCVLCSSFVQRMIHLDRDEVFRYTTLQSDTGIQANQISPNYDSIILVKDQKIYYKSDAILEISKDLHFPHSLLSKAAIIPKFIRDSIYDFIARRRFSIFGKRDQCMIPMAEKAHLFMD